MKKSFKYALAIGIIKKVVLLIFLFSNYSFSQDRTELAIGNIKWGMTKSEIKQEFKKNKTLYTNYKLGNYLYRYYYQNNTYDKNGGVNYVRLTIKGGGMYGVPDVQARLVFKDLVTMLQSTGFTIQNAKTVGAEGIEYTVGEVYSFESVEKDKTVHIALTPGGANTFVNVGVERFKSSQTKYTDDNSF